MALICQNTCKCTGIPLHTSQLRLTAILHQKSCNLRKRISIQVQVVNHLYRLCFLRVNYKVAFLVFIVSKQCRGQEQATAERVAQMFTGQEVDYAALMEGDTLYAGTIASLVSLNFPDFTDIKAVENDYIIAYGVWESLKNPAFAGGAVASEDRVYVTAESVEKVASEELGYDSVLNHHSIERFGDFKFDVITSRYSAPSYGIDVAGYAKVKSCETEGDIVELTVDRTVRVDFPYVAMNAIMRVVKEQQPRIEEQTFDNLCTMRLAIRESRAAELIEKLRKAGGSVRDEAE